jgi:hypothetical protein
MGRSLRQLSKLARNLDKAPSTPTRCQKGHDLTLPGARKLASKGDGRYYWRCMTCRMERRAVERQQRRERIAQERAARRAMGQAMGQTVGTGADSVPYAMPAQMEAQMMPLEAPAKLDTSPFGVTQRALAAYWKLEPDQWTMKHHVIHNRAMYHLLGWPKDGPVRSQPLHNIRVQGARS